MLDWPIGFRHLYKISSFFISQSFSSHSLPAMFHHRLLVLWGCLQHTAYIHGSHTAAFKTITFIVSWQWPNVLYTRVQLCCNYMKALTETTLKHYKQKTRKKEMWDMLSAAIIHTTNRHLSNTWTFKLTLLW